MNEGPFPHSHHRALSRPPDSGPANVVTWSLLVLLIFTFNLIGGNRATFHVPVGCLCVSLETAQSLCPFDPWVVWAVQVTRNGACDISKAIWSLARRIRKKRSKNKKN